MTTKRALGLFINALLISFVIHFLPVAWVDFVEILETAVIAIAILVVYEGVKTK